MEETLETLFIKQQNLIDDLINFKTNFSKSPKERLAKASHLNGRLEILESYMISFRENHIKLSLLYKEKKKDKPDTTYFNEKHNDGFQDMFLDLKSDIVDRIKAISSSADKEISFNHNTSFGDRSLNEERGVHLPIISLPEFNGDYKNWMQFRDLFTGMIHNKPGLDSARKLFYLKKCVSGEAEKIIHSIPCSAANYDSAWQMLCERFDKKRFIIESYLKTLCEQPIMRRESCDSIKKLLYTTKDCLTSIQNLNVKTESWDVLIIFILSQKLDNVTRKNWERFLTTKSSQNRTSKSNQSGIDSEDYDLPKLSEFYEFLEDSFRSLEAIDSKPASIFGETRDKFPNNKRANYVKTFHASNNTSSCPSCNEAHLLYQCINFKSLTHERHSAIKCRSKLTCRKCNKRHNTVMHIENSNHSSNDTAAHPIAGSSNQISHVSTYLGSNSTSQILLATAKVKISTATGDFIFRALIDQGSQVSFVTEYCVQTLELKKNPIHCVIDGIGSKTSDACKNFVELKLNSCINSKFTLLVKALVMTSISNYFPVAKLNSSFYFDIGNLTLADPQFAEPGRIDILLGADVLHEIILDGIIKTTYGPLAQQTQLGWILSGPIKNSNPQNRDVQNILTFHTQVNIDNTLRKFWELEEVSSERVQTTEEKACEKYFQETHYQYIDLNHMELSCYLNDLSESGNLFILPHHGVWKESSSTTKLRIVFDGSSKPPFSKALNEELLPGPILQNNLSSVILRWRAFFVVFTSDIEKMFRQILIHPEKTKFQQIIWRDDPAKPLQLYKLLTVTYGTKCAPFLSIRVLQQLADDEASKYPTGSEILKRDIYVDNIISGADDINKAKKIQLELQKILTSGGFKLRKWSSNSPELLYDLPSEDCEISFNFDGNSDSSIKALGLFWNPHCDNFFFKITLPIRSSHTKRTLLSDAAKLFDPLGWLAPTIILAKIYFQRLWCAGIGWDDPLPLPLKDDWENYRKSLQALEKIKIPRWLGTFTSSFGEVHGFSDASNSAYSAVLYYRCIKDDNISINLITAKTKVAPIKQVSLPRLELCAAVLLAKLFKKFMTAIESQSLNIKPYFWTDSKVVLAWIHALPIRWKTFVANRVTEVQEMTNISDWYHVRSEDNPADCASRGVQPYDLQNHALWWHGPKWLSLPFSKWPNQRVSDCQTELEKKADANSLSANVTPTFDLLLKYSSLNKLLRVTSYIKRLFNFKMRDTFEEYLNPNEIQNSFSCLIRLSQSQYFANEIKDLKSDKQISNKSKISNLYPFIDDEGILPLCPMNDDPSDTRALTPSHFLIGEPSFIVPEPSLLDVKTNHLQRWQQIQQMFQNFWDRWRTEYLTRLQNRPNKLSKLKRNFRVNDIVLITDERFPPAKWPLARVIQVHPGQDDICRVVTLLV
ncbi:uncharacterized protein LOC129950441 [Eupeodes corollae]|uniref:uncharacterized protein LOC129950441 n=1 Tax=Eupeodes corollae TaxID=290404 RepID=UPI0024934E01|nr:uncharacterized protein LOC129950441 [Eupeodes corollae]